MTDALTTRLLAEIERREEIARDALGPDELGDKRTYYRTHGPYRDDWNLWVYAVPVDVVLAYLAALQAIVRLHTGPHRCHDLDGTVEIVRDECDTLLAVASALGVEAWPRCPAHGASGRRGR